MTTHESMAGNSLIYRTSLSRCHRYYLLHPRDDEQGQWVGSRRSDVWNGFGDGGRGDEPGCRMETKTRGIGYEVDEKSDEGDFVIGNTEETDDGDESGPDVIDTGESVDQDR